MLEVSVIVQNGDQNGRSGFDVFLVDNSLTKNTGLLYTFLGNEDSEDEAKETAKLWKAALHNFADNGKEEVRQLKSAGFTFCAVHNSVSRGNRCDEVEGEIKAHEDNLVTKELEEIEEEFDGTDVTKSKRVLPLILTDKEKRKLEKKHKIEPLEVRECVLHELFYMVPTKI